MVPHAFVSSTGNEWNRPAQYSCSIAQSANCSSGQVAQLHAPPPNAVDVSCEALPRCLCVLIASASCQQISGLQQRLDPGCRLLGCLGPQKQIAIRARDAEARRIVHDRQHLAYASDPYQPLEGGPPRVAAITIIITQELVLQHEVALVPVGKHACGREKHQQVRPAVPCAVRLHESIF